jgi:outer membrane protein TolC
MAPWARGENLAEAWRIALNVNQQLQAEQMSSLAAGENVAAARAARVPSIRTTTFDTYIADSPRFNTTLALSSSGSGTAGMTSVAGANGAIPVAFPILGKNQHNVPVSYTAMNVPIFTSGRIQGGIDAARGQLNAQRANEFQTAIDLKLTVSEAYLGVLRAKRNLQLARSNLAQLASFAEDVTNRVQEGVATRNDQLAAEVAHDNAQLREVRAVNSLNNAWATYNRYLCRPPTTLVSLEEIAIPTGDDRGGDAIGRATRVAAIASPSDPAEVEALADLALRTRPELVGLAEQARSANAQSRVAAAGHGPQVLFSGGLIFAGNAALSPQANFVGTFLLDWTPFDGGASRRRSNAFHLQEDALLRRRADAAADIVLQVRTQWNNLQEARFRVRVARHAIIQSEENIRVVRDRYQRQLSIYTEVLDAETRRLESLTNFYDAFYDQALAEFRLHRAVGDL